MSKICKNCGTELPDTVKFCGKCGNSVIEEEKNENLFCPQCGASLELGARFCGKCGTAISSETGTGQELKQLADSAKLAAKAGMDNARKGLAKGMALAGGKISSTAEKLQNNTDDIPKENMKNQQSTGGAEQEQKDHKTNIRSSSENWNIKKWGKRVLIILAAVFIVKGLFFGPDRYIRAVKGGVLPKYDYGVNLGKSLHTWLAGEETWDTYENGDVRYVSVSGVCPYATSAVMGDGEKQTFYFQIIDKDHFYFIGAYNMDGVPICTDTGNYYLNEYIDLLSDLPYVDTNFYEAALKAAFGDKESLNVFKRMSNQL